MGSMNNNKLLHELIDLKKNPQISYIFFWLKMIDLSKLYFRNFYECNTIILS